MSLARVLLTAVRALRRNVSRSALTILGIVIGIAAVIAMMEIGQGSSLAIAQTIASMGANNVLVMPGAAASGGVSFGSGSSVTLTAEDCEAILRECDAVQAAAPLVRLRSAAIHEGKNWVPDNTYGTTSDYLAVRDWTELAEGEPFTDGDVRNAGRVCLVGQTIVRELFGGESPIGKDLRLQNVSFRVVGVLARKGASTFGRDQDDLVLAPWTTVKYRLAGSSAAQSVATSAPTGTSGGTLYPGSASPFPPQTSTELAGRPPTARFANVDQILVAARSPGDIKLAMAQITALLRERHHLRPDEPNDFNLRDMTEGANALASTTTMMTNLLLTVALISLVVGGVGIMNIMLVSVTERTREIGLRMAVGARSSDVLKQFLVEATLLCLIGGVLGLALGRTGSLVVENVLNWPVKPSIAAVVASIGVSAFVGIVFGFYPAWKASRLDPIEALRYE